MYYVIHLLDSKSYKGGKKMERTKMCDIPIREKISNAILRGRIKLQKCLFLRNYNYFCYNFFMDFSR